MINAFLLTDDIEILKKSRASGAERITVATRFPQLFCNEKSVTVFKIVEKIEDCEYENLYLSSLYDDEIVDAVLDKALSGLSKVIVPCSYSLNEIGKCFSLTKLSPIQYLHKIGLLDCATVVGGVHLDRDDIDLMAQTGTPLILCPTSSMGYGYGTPHFCALEGKVEVSLGSGDCAFNKSGDMIQEARALLLGVNSDMRERKLTAEKLAKLIGLNPKNAHEKIFR